MDETLPKLVGSRDEGGQTGLVGAGGKDVWTLKTVAEGRATIYLKYVRLWEKDSGPANTRFWRGSFSELSRRRGGGSPERIPLYETTVRVPG